MLLLLLTAAIVFLLPDNALAWGPITHIVHGSGVLTSLGALPDAVRAVLAANPSCYLYGCVGADIIQAKSYSGDLAGHCHRWPVAWRFVDEAESDREKAFAWGYMTHLAADILSHNHFVPSSLLRSFASPALGHAYWEARADALQEPRHRELVKQLLARSFADCDGLVERVITRTLLSFKTNKRIFDSLLAVSRLNRWQGFVRRVSARSRYELHDDTLARYNAACIAAAVDLLAEQHASYTQDYDPTGEEVLLRAIALRRRLRALKRARRLDAALEAEIAEQMGLEELPPDHLPAARG